MPERWKKALGTLDRLNPDPERLRTPQRLLERASREPAQRRVAAIVVALALMVGSFMMVRSAFFGGSGDGVASGSIDAAKVCDVPRYEADAVLLVGSETNEYPLSVLQAPGQPVSALPGPGGEALRKYVASESGRNAPTDGWRVLPSPEGTAMFAAPANLDAGYNQWWVVGFDSTGDSWQLTREELAEQQPTAAQRGHSLELSWDGDVVLREGSWNSPLLLVNGGSRHWVESSNVYWATPHIFNLATGQEIATVSPASATSDGGYDIPPGEAVPIPIALGDVLSSLTRGAYGLVACVPELGLASPLGHLDVVSTGVVAKVRVLTYRHEDSEMDALTTGSLAVLNGCLAIESSGEQTYIIWPRGYALISRQDATVLVDPIGREVAALGQEVQLAGGFATLPLDAVAHGEVPDACRVTGERYFITSGAQ